MQFSLHGAELKTAIVETNDNNSNLAKVSKSQTLSHNKLDLSHHIVTFRNNAVTFTRGLNMSEQSGWPSSWIQIHQKAV